jgi:hypothetical protein
MQIDFKEVFIMKIGSVVLAVSAAMTLGFVETMEHYPESAPAKYLVSKGIISIPQAPKEAVPVAFIETGTGRCVTTYEPSNKSLHACWPVLPEDTRKVAVYKGIEPTEIGDHIDMYLDAPSR